MITGFNTDVEHAGVVYHVQTEDKGIETPLILSLVYSGGAILASKRTPYDDLIAEGFDEAVLAERLKRQHRLICAAIHSGRLDELKQMSARPPETVLLSETQNAASQTEPLPRLGTVSEFPESVAPVEPVNQAPTPAPAAPSAYTVYDSRRHRQGMSPEISEGLRINLLDDETEFHGGDSVSLRIVITQLTPDDERAVGGAAVSVKILGTTFRPVLHSVKTSRDGDVAVKVDIPSFSSGRAAILIRATADDQSAEIRRVIQPG